MEVKEIPISEIRRPLPRQTDPDKVQALMKSIATEGLHEPIDVLEVEGSYYGFSGCHRFEAHQRLSKETIKCRVRHAPRSVLEKHLA
ncbi:chromosome partitioning protein ParB [Aphanothece hegewaldii CCALA 016]|uniref:sulfiredoxin n=1 Tax=Aphanothece hegewaldii CCALA 016 TaxID=2107694 RepID=A0A2T1LY71_9CHRO|nr:sulfiredoxin [Aphanothece hegewaldii]PSF37341.1 chromosome partitioning protein ParB [Aphanothece hegewaldii CCALA 016]